MERLAGKVAVITGGAGGMGSAHVKRFIKEGAKVVIADLAVSNGANLAKELGNHALFIELDVTSEANWISLVEQTEKAFGPIDILVNNAGYISINAIENLSYDEYKKTIAINQDSIFLGMKHVYPSMKKTKNGSIVNISSASGIAGGANHSAYIAAKFAVRGLTKAAAAEFVADNIRVNSVHPGSIRTPMTDQESNRDIVKAMIADVPMKRLAESEEITNSVLYLASDESSFSTAAEFIADGGLTQII